MPSKVDNPEYKWVTGDDRVMGGKSYSWCDLESGYGKFYGIASSDGGGFSTCRMIDEKNVAADFSGYDGLVLEVASQDPLSLSFGL